MMIRRFWKYSPLFVGARPGYGVDTAEQMRSAGDGYSVSGGKRPEPGVGRYSHAKSWMGRDWWNGVESSRDNKRRFGGCGDHWLMTGR